MNPRKQRSGVFTPTKPSALALTVVLCLHVSGTSASAAPTDLRVIATNGTPIGGARITTIRPRVSFNSRGTVALAASHSEGRSTVFAARWHFGGSRLAKHSQFEFLQ